MKILKDEDCRILWQLHLRGYMRYNPQTIKSFKRPFGNSDWEDDIIELTKKKFTSSNEDELSDMKWDYGNQAMEELIEWAKINSDKLVIEQ